MNKNEYVNPYNYINKQVVIDTSYCFMKVYLINDNEDYNGRMEIKLSGFNTTATHEARIVLNWTHDDSNPDSYTWSLVGSSDSYPGYNVKACRLKNIVYLFFKSSIAGELVNIWVTKSNHEDYLFLSDTQEWEEEWDEIKECDWKTNTPYTLPSKVIVDTTFGDASYQNDTNIVINVALSIQQEKTYEDTILEVSSAWAIGGVLIGLYGNVKGLVFPLRRSGTSLKSGASYIENIPVGHYRAIAMGRRTGTRPTWDIPESI